MKDEERHMLKNDLCAAIAKNPQSLAIVVGAGVSIGCLPEPADRSLGSWGGLLREGLRRCEIQGQIADAEQARLQGLLGSDKPEDWIAVAEAVTSGLGGVKGGEFRRWLRETAGSFSAKCELNPTLQAIDALAQRGALIATVNYDGVLERATGLPPVSWRDEHRVERVLRGDDAAVLHLHGYWEDPESVVLGGSSYQEVRNASHAQAVLSTLRMSRTLLFVGHGAGLADPNWGPFLRWTEDVFAGSEYRHFRLVRDAEVEQVQAQHPAAQRIVTLSYGDSHDDLGPFLQSLLPENAEGSVPPAPSERAGELEEGHETRRTVVLRINIGDQEYDWLSEEMIRAQVLKHLGESDPVMLPEVRRRVNRDAIHPREWRGIARSLLVLREQVRAAVATGESVQYVVAGQAPLPVFAYLGQLMQRAEGPIIFMNRRINSGGWDIVTGTAPLADRDLFDVVPPERGPEDVGRVALSIRCSSGYPALKGQLEARVKAEGSRLLGTYEIVSGSQHKKVPMTDADLSVLLEHVRSAFTWMDERCESMDGLIVALGGPAWVAFWVGQELNPYVFGGRVDFPNMVGAGKGRRYVRALASPMHKAPWLSTPAKVLIIGAEPDNGTRTRGAKAAGSIQRALEREHGRNSATYDLRVVGAVTIDEFMRELNLENPDILHLHLHGTENAGGMTFEDEQGEGKYVSADSFVSMIESTNVRPAVVVLSACNSMALGPALVTREGLVESEIAECVIYMDGVVGYGASIDFASSFYGAIGRGESLAMAIQQGRSRVRAAWGEKASELIKYKLAPGVIAAEVLLLPKPRNDR